MMHAVEIHYYCRTCNKSTTEYFENPKFACLSGPGGLNQCRECYEKEYYAKLEADRKEK